MRQLIFVCAVLCALTLSLVGCGGGASSVVGTWKPDVNSLKVKMADAKMQPMVDQAMGKQKEAMGKMSMTFNADGTYTGTDPDGTTKTGKYTVSGNTVSIDADKKDPNQKEPTATLSGDGKTISVHSEMTTPAMTIDMNFVKAS